MQMYTNADMPISFLKEVDKNREEIEMINSFENSVLKRVDMDP